jgi:hypothetical protein
MIAGKSKNLLILNHYCENIKIPNSIVNTHTYSTSYIVLITSNSAGNKSFVVTGATCGQSYDGTP